MNALGGWAAVAAVCGSAWASPPGQGGDLEESPSRLSDEVIEPQVHRVPPRPGGLLELGDKFLSTGPLRESVELPTGAVLQPSLLVFGTYRSAVQSFDNGTETFSEWANRLDLFANLQLSGTERVLYGVRPLDDSGGFSGYHFDPDTDNGGQNNLNWRTTTLFFEGELGEMFPGLDPHDRHDLDLGFSVGRQPLRFQDGLIVNDRIDAVAVVKNSLTAPGIANLRATGLVGWNEINRGNNRGTLNPEDRSAMLYGLFLEADTRTSTLALDTVYVSDDDGDSDAFYIGGSTIQRVGTLNTTFRVAGSVPLHGDTPEVRGGVVALAEFSSGVHHSNDLIYFNAFWGIDEFTSAARSPETGGPLGQVGILYSAVGIGRYGAALGSDSEQSVGFAAGRQFFYDDTRTQIILEVGGRTDTDGSERAAVAAGARWQRAVGENAIVRVDGFAAGREGLAPSYGARVEFVFKF